LRQKKPHASQEWLVKLPQTAKRLDEILFSAAPSLAVYRDYSTLEQRLRQLALNKIKAQRMEEAQMLRIRLQQAHNRKVPSRVVDHTYHDYSNYPVQDPVVKMSFPKKLHEILSNPEFEHIISWMPHGRAWKLHSRDLFQTEVAPKYFHQEKFASFSRQLTGWGFKRLTKQGPDFNSYYHQCFLRDRPDLVVLLKRVPNNLGRSTPDANNEPNFYALHPAWFKKREDDSMRSDLSKKESSVSVSVPYKSNMHATSLDNAAATALISLSSVPNKSLLSHELKVSSKRPVLPLRNRREHLAQYLIQHQDHSQQNQYKHELLLPQKQVTKAVAAKLQSMVPKVANGPKGKYYGTNTNHTAEVDHYSNALFTAKTPTAMLPKVMKARGKYKVKLPKVMRTTGKHSDTETERSGRWTEVEHNAFLEGLEMYGKKWKKVSRHIKTRSVIQTRTHAQKYYLMLNKDGLHDDHVENVTDKKSTENELLATCTGKEHEMRPHTVPNKPMSQPIEKLPDKPQNNSPNVRAQVPDNYYYYHKYLRKVRLHTIICRLDSFYFYSQPFRLSRREMTSNIQWPISRMLKFKN
jgi:SHAQKYF class myb-like DNA-binding protein